MSDATAAMSDATAAMNDATSGERVRNRPKLLPEQHPPEQRQRRSRLDDLRRRPLVDGADPILLGEPRRPRARSCSPKACERGLEGIVSARAGNIGTETAGRG